MALLLFKLAHWPRLLLALFLAIGGACPAAQAQYYLNISQQKLTLPDRVLYVEQVVDGRPTNEKTVGTLYKGLNDKAVVVLFRQSMETELATWFQQQLPQRPTDHPVIVCIRKLWVGETVDGTMRNAVASAELVAEIHVHSPDGYHFVRGVADNMKRPGIDNNADHAAHLAFLLERCLKQVVAADWELAMHRPAKTLAQLTNSKSQVVARPAILRATTPRSGVYRNIDQFLNNQPDTTAQISIDTVRWSLMSSSISALSPNAPVQSRNSPNWRTSTWRGTVHLRAKVRAANGDRVPQREVWGFSDGRQAYFRQFNTYRPLTRQGSFYTFIGAAPLDLTAPNQRGGLARPSGALARSATGAPLDVNDDNSGEPMVFALDLRTGQTAQFPPPGLPARADTAFVYVYRPAGGPPEAQRLLLNDREVGQLRPGEYRELTSSHYGAAMRLSLESAGGPSLLIVPSTTTANYIKLKPGSALTPWQLMTAHEGEAEVDSLEKKHK